MVKTNPNKPNLPEGKIDAKSVFTKDYEEICGLGLWKNKANSKPISEKAEMNVNFYLTKDYENVPLRRRGENKPKQSQSVFFSAVNVK